MRGPACFTNCCPAPAPVVITANTYAIGANEIGWALEMFGPGGKPISALPAGVDDLSFGISGALPATYALKLAHPPVSPNAVQLTLKGTATQRPLVGLNGYASDDSESGAVMNAHDYFVIGSTVYITFALDAAVDTIYVRYQSMPGAAEASAGITGMMRYYTAAVTANVPVAHWVGAVKYYRYAGDGLTAPAYKDGTEFGESKEFVVGTGEGEYTSATLAVADALIVAVEADWRAAVLAVNENGWLRADGFTEYRINLYSALYAFLDDAGLLETSSRATHFIITKLAVPLGASTNLVLVKA